MQQLLSAAAPEASGPSFVPRRLKKMPKQFLTNIIGVLCRRLRVTNNMYMRAKYGDKDLTWLG